MCSVLLSSRLIACCVFSLSLAELESPLCCTCPSGPEGTRPLPPTLLKRDFGCRCYAASLCPEAFNKSPPLPRRKQEGKRGNKERKCCEVLLQFLLLHFVLSFTSSSSSSSPTWHPFLSTQLFLPPLLCFFDHRKLLYITAFFTDIPETPQPLFVAFSFGDAAVQSSSDFGQLQYRVSSMAFLDEDCRGGWGEGNAGITTRYSSTEAFNWGETSAEGKEEEGGGGGGGRGKVPKERERGETEGGGRTRCAGGGMSRLQIHTGKWRMVTGCIEVMGKPMEDPEQEDARRDRTR